MPGTPRGGRVMGGGREKSLNCKFCLNIGISGPHDHYLRDYRKSNSPIVCPRLLNTKCGNCNELGHTKLYCNARITKANRVWGNMKPIGQSNKYKRYNDKVSSSDEMRWKVKRNSLSVEDCFTNFHITTDTMMDSQEWPSLGSGYLGEGEGEGAAEGEGEGVCEGEGGEGEVPVGARDVKPTWANMVEATAYKKVTGDPTRQKRYRERREKLFGNLNMCRGKASDVKSKYMDSDEEDEEFEKYDYSYFNGDDDGFGPGYSTSSVISCS